MHGAGKMGEKNYRTNECPIKSRFATIMADPVDPNEVTSSEYGLVALLAV
jgi:hypothetical protein